MGFLTALLGMWTVLQAFSDFARSEEWKAQLVSLAPEKNTKFEWKVVDLPVLISSEENLPSPKVILAGKYKGPSTDQLLRVDSKRGQVPLRLKDGNFTDEIQLLGDSTSVTLLAISPLGSIEEEKIILLFKDWVHFESQNLNKIKRPHLYASFGLSSLSYQEGSIANYSALASTFKTSYTRSVFSPQWDVGANFFLTLFNVSSRPPISMPDTAVRFFGMNLRFGYVFPFVKAPWRVSLLGGLYFIKMFVSENRFGFNHVAYPQIFPTVSRVLSSTDSVSAYLKYVPTSKGIGLSWNEKELAFGSTWEHRLSNEHPLTVSFDISNLTLVDFAGIENSLGTLSLSFGYGL